LLLHRLIKLASLDEVVAVVGPELSDMSRGRIILDLLDL
jgi:hypothetical protein